MADLAKVMGLNVPVGAQLTVAETEVFSGTSPNTWTDLDLSGTIGANAALVLLKFSTTYLGGITVAFRKNGDTDEFYKASPPGGAGASLIYQGATVIHRVIIVATDTAGKIEWKASGEETGCTIDIIAYIK